MTRHERTDRPTVAKPAYSYTDDEQATLPRARFTNVIATLRAGVAAAVSRRNAGP